MDTRGFEYAISVCSEPLFYSECVDTDNDGDGVYKSFCNKEKFFRLWNTRTRPTPNTGDVEGIEKIVRDYAERFMVHYTPNAPAHDYGIKQIAQALLPHMSKEIRLPEKKPLADINGKKLTMTLKEWLNNEGFNAAIDKVKEMNQGSAPHHKTEPPPPLT